MSPTKVLIVEDEPDFASLLQEWLEEEGYEVGHVPSGGVRVRHPVDHV